MKKHITFLVLLLSLILNIVLLCIINYAADRRGTENNTDQGSAKNKEELQRRAESFVRTTVCENLYYPDSYDPVKTTIDSAYFGPLTDPNCVKAAGELIDLRSQYLSAQAAYNEAVDEFKFFGRTDFGHSHWGKDRDTAKAKMEELQAKIERRQSIIKNRGTSMDGRYIGWQVVHRYRAANSDGVVSFGNILYIVDPDFTECYFRYSLDDNDKNNFEMIKDVIYSELGLQKDD